MVELDECYPERVRKSAEAYFRNDLLNCAESALKALLVEAGLPCPVQVTSLASAFGRGMGGAGCCCGALIGGQMALGFLFGRTEERGEPPARCARLAKELHDRFVAKNRASCCRILHRGMPYGSAEQFDACAVRAAEAAELAARIFLEEQKKTALPASGGHEL